MTDKITVNAQSSIRIEAEKIVYFDPFKITSESHDGDIVFITHAHHDHFSPEDIKKIAKPDTVFVIPEGMTEELIKKGFSKDKIIAVTAGDSRDILGIPAEAMPSYNTNKPMHPRSKGWLGYVVTVCGTRVYVCGDTDETPEALAVKCDIVMPPIGGTFTMNAREAAAFVNKLAPKTAIPTHYGTIVGSKKDGEKFKSLVSGEIEVCLKL